jgi:F420-dependent oxidoreductase-like protein
VTWAADRLGLSLSPSQELDIPAITRVAVEAESLGYESIWIPETWGVDSVSVLAALAVATSRIRLASGIFNVFSRSPALIAQTAATLQELSRNRFILGLGSSGPVVVERWHGMPFSSPIERTRLYVDIIRLALSGSRVDYHKHGFDLSGFRLGNPPSALVPVYIAAIGPNNVRLCGELADGWLPIFVARGRMKEFFGSLSEGAALADRDPMDIDVAAFVPGTVADRADELLRRQLAYYVGGMGTFYFAFVERMGFAADAQKIRQLWSSGERKLAIRAVPQELLDLCTLGDGAEPARERLQLLREDGIRLPIVTFPHGSTEAEISRTLQTLAPATGPAAEAV